jgi:SAM-dependent methyltransferase
MDSVKAFLRKWPKLHRVLAKIYYICRYLIEVHIVGTRLQEWAWKRRRSPQTGKSGIDLVETINHAHRKIIMSRISCYPAFETFLEIGCGTGPNLHLVSKKYPDAEIYGIDINLKAIQEGNRLLKKYDVKNVELFAGRALDLGMFEDKGIDVVLTDATLMYIGADMIDKVLQEIGRICSFGAIFSEWHCNDSTRDYIWYDGHWIHNYERLLWRHFCHRNMSILKYPEGIWFDEGWRKYGSIMEVRSKR